MKSIDNDRLIDIAYFCQTVSVDRPLYSCNFHFKNSEHDGKTGSIERCGCADLSVRIKLAYHSGRACAVGILIGGRVLSRCSAWF